MNYPQKKFNRGFTLVELLVVIGITAMLAGIAVTYTNVAKNQVALTVEASKVGGTLYRAKDLAVATYNITPAPGGAKTCGYGVIIDRPNNKYSLFAFVPDKARYLASYGVDVSTFCPKLAQVQAAGLTLNTCGGTVEVASTSQATWNVAVQNSIKLIAGSAGDDLSVALFYPPNPDVLLSSDPVNGCTAQFQTTPKTLRSYFASPDGKASTSVSINPAGQITF